MKLLIIAALITFVIVSGLTMFLTGTFKKTPPQGQLPDEGQSTGLLAGSQEGLADYGSRIAAVEAKLVEMRRRSLQEKQELRIMRVG